MPESSGQHTSGARCTRVGGEDTRARSDAPYQIPANSDRLVAIVGPTAVGKTALAMRLAQRVPVEIVGADSRQVYRHMHIGTAKPSPEERSSVPHHIVDIIEPDYEFSLREYISLAKDAIKNVNNRGKVPILVGGTGQYVMALLEGWSVPPVPPDTDLRARLDVDLAVNGIGSLVQQLKDLDPAALETVDLKNPRRIIRAIERASAGHLLGAKQEREAPSFDSKVIGLGAGRGQLYARADLRLDSMMEEGFLEEVEWLLAAGYSPQLPALSGIGYSELVEYLLKGTDLQDAIQHAKYRTHRYIRQQSNWFRASDTRIDWFKMSDIGAAIDFAQSWIESPQNCHNQ